MSFNSAFDVKKIDFDRDIIACLGNNSGVSPEARDYMMADGYLTAAESILMRAYGYEDCLFYPFAFNCRQSIELMCKICIEGYYKVNNIKTVKSSELLDDKVKPVLKIHDVEALIGFIVTNAEFVDSRIKSKVDTSIDNLEKAKDFYFDKEGDSFRYTFNVQRTAININNETHASMTTMYKNTKDCYDALEDLYLELGELIKEINTGTRTTRLNRTEIFKFAKRYLEIEGNAREKQNILTKEFDLKTSTYNRVIDTISKNRKLCTYLGQEMPFKDISADTMDILRKVVDLVGKKKSGLGAISTWIKNIQGNSPIEKEIVSLMKNIDEQTAKVIVTYYEMGRNYYYVVEQLEAVYDSMQKNIAVDTDYILHKINIHFIEFLRRGLDVCGQTTMLKRLDSKFPELTKLE